MKAEDFILKYYDWSSRDLEKLQDQLNNINSFDYGCVTDLMEMFADYKVHKALKEYENRL